MRSLYLSLVLFLIPLLQAQQVIKIIRPYVLIDTVVGTLNEPLDVVRFKGDDLAIVGSIRIITHRDGKTAAKIMNETSGFRIVVGDMVGNQVNNMKKDAPKVFLDGDRLDRDYIRTEIPFVNYVLDRKIADVHILITTQRTGSGGREYTIGFIGQNGYVQTQSTLKYYGKSTDTDNETREGLVRILKLGLAPDVADTPMAEAISVEFNQDDSYKATDVKDPWDFWVFNLSANSRLRGETSQKSTSLSGGLSINRVTDASKLQIDFRADYKQDRYHLEDEDDYTSQSRELIFTGLYVKSLSSHWSIGVWLNIESSTYRNMDLAIRPQPAIEYNFFPYSESTRRQLRLLYKAGYENNRYKEETIYDKFSEELFSEALSLSFELNEPWGEAKLTVEGSHYFHDFDKRRLKLNGQLSVRIFKGLSLSFWGNYESTNDQLSLPKEGASVEEVLLQRRELASDFRYSLSVGLSYRFGSIYSNVVNPRFGQGRRRRN